ncbi:AraC family transcriptional regulator [Sphingomonas sp. UYAg733]
MREATRIDYAERIDRVAAHLESMDLGDRPATLEALAEIAALSPHHFHRVYRLMTGETIGDTVRRVRLARSLPRLRERGVSVTEAAAASGYATSQAFARAIRAVTGRSASAARSSDEAANELAAVLGRGSTTGAPLSVEIVSTAPFRVAAIRNIGAYAELDQVFERLFAILFAELPTESLIGVHGIPHDDPRFTAADDVRFDCALDLGQEAQLPSNVISIPIAGGPHIRLRHVGSYETIFATVDLAYAVALARGLAFADAPLRIHYVDTPEDAPEDQLRSDIYLPISLR